MVDEGYKGPGLAGSGKDWKPRRYVTSGYRYKRLLYGGALGTLEIIWKGDAIEEAGPAACANAINEVMELCVANAKLLVRVDTQRLKDSIRVIKAATPGDRISASWGSDVYYAIFQEIGPVTGKYIWGYTPYLRPSADRYYPELGPRALNSLPL